MPNSLMNGEALVALVTLTALELVLGIDNVVFISILAARLPEGQQERVRVLGLTVAAASRLLLLFSIYWVMGLRTPLFLLFGHEFSGRDLILIAGGLFLLYKATSELHDRLEGEENAKGRRAASTLGGVLLQVFFLDMVFALDSIITAVGMVEQIGIMVLAILLSVFLMIAISRFIHAFVTRHPTIKVLALAFLLLIGVVLISEGFDVHVPKGYVYFAMGFSVFVELLNMRVRKAKAPPIALRSLYAPPTGPDGPAR